MLEDKLDRIELFRGLACSSCSSAITNSRLSHGRARRSTGWIDCARREGCREDERAGSRDRHQPCQRGDVFRRSSGVQRPALITHAGCAAVYPHPRNKSDALLRAVAQKGGVVGIYDLPYLTPSPKQPTVDDYIVHMTHALSVCGEDHVGVGSDSDLGPFDTSPKAMADFARRKSTARNPVLPHPAKIARLTSSVSIRHAVRKLSLTPCSGAVIRRASRKRCSVSTLSAPLDVSGTADPSWETASTFPCGTLHVP